MVSPCLDFSQNMAQVSKIIRGSILYRHIQHYEHRRSGHQDVRKVNIVSI